jgi:predicted glycoside hydrolase/deacetylase ChbG (UPF0249 family)
MAASSAAIIITADDFGFTSPINHAVALSFERGLITHASLMVNMPATEEASELAHALAVADRIGCHLNLADGVPLTDAIRRSKTFCAGGEFNEPLGRRMFLPLSSSDKRAVADEIRAQIASVRSRGLAGVYLDSHRYVHTAPNIASVVVAVAREMGVRRVRPFINCGPTFVGVKGVGKVLFNGWLASHELKRVRYFGDIDDVMSLAADGAQGIESAEVMTHPVLDEAGQIADGSAGLLAERLAELQALFPTSFVASGTALRYDK